MPYTIIRVSALSMMFLARACGEESADAPTSASDVAAAEVVTTASGPVVAKHGGAIVAAGPAQLEVVSHASGQVYAYPEAGIENPGRARVTTTVAVQGGTRPVEMRWVPRERRYVGRVENATIIPGPATIAVVVGDVHYVGVSPILVVSPAIVVDVVPAIVEVGYHGKHKHRGHGHGHGHGHGNDGVRIRVH